MSKFYVGQRVRIKFIDHAPHRFFSHQEAVILARDNELNTWDLDVIGYGSEFYGKTITAHECNLEPLNPPKSQIDEILAMRDLPNFEIARVAA